MKRQIIKGRFGLGAVIYCRVSTKEQVSNMSLGTQERHCRDFCKALGVEVLEVFVDEGESARNVERPKFVEMFNYCAKNKNLVGRVVVYDTTRFSRIALDYHTLEAVLAKLGIDLVSVKEPFDNSPVGKFIKGIFAQVAQLDNDVRGDRTRVGMRAAAQSGRWTSRTPLGYRRGGPKPDVSLVPDPIMGPIISSAFEMVGSGAYTPREALEKATALGLLTAKAKKVNLQSFYYTLRKPVYFGQIVFSKDPD